MRLLAMAGPNYVSGLIRQCSKPLGRQPGELPDARVRHDCPAIKLASIEIEDLVGEMT
jgi:hypothetical protein